MKQTLVIKGRLAGRNEAEKAARTHWTAGARLKREETEKVALSARAQGLAPYRSKVEMTISFFEQNERRDADNVFGGIKYILDGLVAGGILENDTRKQVECIHMLIATDKANPRVEVEMEDEETNNRDDPSV